MNRPDYKLYELDLTAKSTFNAINGEYGKRNGGEFENLVIPINAPFYQESVKMYHPDGSPMIFGEDYEFYGIMADLTAYTAHDVGLFIKLNKPEITEYIIDYQIVGNHNILTREILNMLRTAAQDDRPVEWNNIDGKPLWYDPKLHQHDYTYDFFLFGDLAKQIKRVQSFSGSFNNGVQTQLDTFLLRADAYIAQYTSVIKSLLDTHDASKVDPHGVWKTHIGLGDVDNFKTASLQEVIEGVRDDLHMRPADAVKAVELVAADNQRLYPSGNLPLLRYGSDGYIPPKIDGSFEGMGGRVLRGGACIESDNTLVFLQRRYNGREKGLYFLRCQRWETERPSWDFTGYRYKHPTATADGANINVMLSGSTGNFLVIGDEDKNIWYWAYGNGTFNPDRHVLNRISGDWLKYGSLWRYAQVIAPEDDKGVVGIVQAISSQECKVLRPSFIKGPSDNPCEGWSLFLNIAGGGVFDQATIDYDTQIPGIGNPKDKLFIPYPMQMDGNGNVTRCTIKPKTNPLRSVWMFHNPNAVLRKGADGSYSIAMGSIIYFEDAVTSNGSYRVVLWRGTLQPTITGGKTTCKLIPGKNERLYTVEVNDWDVNPDQSTADFVKYKDDESDNTHQFGPEVIGGSVYLRGGYKLRLASSNGVTIPCVVRLWKNSGYADADLLRDGGGSSQMIYDIVMREQNPIGLSAGFSNSFYGVANSEDPLSSVVIAREMIGMPGITTDISGKTIWKARRSNFLNSNWDVVPGGNVTLGGVSAVSHQYGNEVYKLNIGPGVVLCGRESLPSNPLQVKKAGYADIFGADPFTTIDGVVKTPAGKVKGDGLLRLRNSISLVGDTITYKPLVVCNVRDEILRVLPAMMTSLGMGTTQLADTWTLLRTWDLQHKEYFVLMVGDILPNPAPNQNLGMMRVAVAPIEITPVGPGVQKDGYTYHDKVTISFTKPLTGPTALFDRVWSTAPIIAIDSPQHLSGASMTGINRKDANGNVLKQYVYGHGSFHISVVGNALFMAPLIEVQPDRTLKVVAFHHTEVGVSDRGTIMKPGGGMGFAGYVLGSTEGSAVVYQEYNDPGVGNDIAPNILANTASGVPKIGFNNLVSGGFVVYFKEIDNLLIAGKKYNMEGSYQDLRNVDPNPANKTFYIYLRYWMGGPAHVIETSMLPETSVCGLVAIVRCGATQIESITPYNRFTMDGIQISSSRQGSSIIGARGSVYNVGDDVNILLPTDFLPE